MEFIEGETLEDRLETIHQRGDHLPLAQALNIARQLCIVLEYLHSQQPPVIFRDLKPANIMLNKQQQIYLIDFGIARLFKPGQSKDTTALGSPGYAPPEQYRQATSPRSDIYSLGATLHQMLTGIDPSQHPFYFQPFSINQPALERLVQRMVALDEKQRPASMQVVKQSLESIIQPRKPQQQIGIPKPQKSPIAPSARIANGVQIQKNKPQSQQAGGKTSQYKSQPPAISPAPSAPITVHTVISTSTTDRHLWLSIREQLHKLVTGFPDIRFTESNLPTALRGADIVLLLLSADFLASSSCMTSAATALKQHDAQQARVLSIVLRPCAWDQSDLARIKTIPEDSVTHLSIYAQEQRILEAAKEIRRLVAIAALRGKTAGTMNLLQWLLWQLYGEGRKFCPYFKADTGRYALQHMRSSGLAGIILNLIDLQQERIVNEYLIGPLNNSPDMRHLLAMLAPSSTDPEEVQGTASRRYPSNVIR
jgi:serine/threonine protein kinase